MVFRVSVILHCAQDDRDPWVNCYIIAFFIFYLPFIIYGSNAMCLQGVV